MGVFFVCLFLFRYSQKRKGFVGIKEGSRGSGKRVREGENKTKIYYVKLSKNKEKLFLKRNGSAVKSVCVLTADLDWFRAPMWPLTTIFNFSLSWSDALFWPMQATDTLLVHTYTCKPNTQRHKVKVKTNSKKKGKGTLHNLIYIYI